MESDNDSDISSNSDFSSENEEESDFDENSNKKSSNGIHTLTTSILTTLDNLDDSLVPESVERRRKQQNEKVKRERKKSTFVTSLLGQQHNNFRDIKYNKPLCWWKGQILKEMREEEEAGGMMIEDLDVLTDQEVLDQIPPNETLLRGKKLFKAAAIGILFVWGGPYLASLKRSREELRKDKLGLKRVIKLFQTSSCNWFSKLISVPLTSLIQDKNIKFSILVKEDIKEWNKPVSVDHLSSSEKDLVEDGGMNPKSRDQFTSIVVPVDSSINTTISTTFKEVGDIKDGDETLKISAQNKLSKKSAKYQDQFMKLKVRIVSIISKLEEAIHGGCDSILLSFSNSSSQIETMKNGKNIESDHEDHEEKVEEEAHKQATSTANRNQPISDSIIEMLLVISSSGNSFDFQLDDPYSLFSSNNNTKNSGNMEDGLDDFQPLFQHELDFFHFDHLSRRISIKEEEEESKMEDEEIMSDEDLTMFIIQFLIMRGLIFNVGLQPFNHSIGGHLSSISNSQMLDSKLCNIRLVGSCLYQLFHLSFPQYLPSISELLVREDERARRRRKREKRKKHKNADDEEKMVDKKQSSSQNVQSSPRLVSKSGLRKQSSIDEEERESKIVEKKSSELIDVSKKEEESEEQHKEEKKEDEEIWWIYEAFIQPFKQWLFEESAYTKENVRNPNQSTSNQDQRDTNSLISLSMNDSTSNSSSHMMISHFYSMYFLFPFPSSSISPNNPKTLVSHASPCCLTELNDIMYFEVFEPLLPKLQQLITKLVKVMKFKLILKQQKEEKEEEEREMEQNMEEGGAVDE